MNQKQHSLMQVLQKISIFKGLELGHIQRLLKVGTSQRYGIGETIYSIGEESTDMLVLLQGRLVSVLASNQMLHIIILKNVVEILSERLLAANEQNDALQHQLTQLETDGDDDYTPSVTNDGQADEYDEYPGDEE
tara:strand:+ start:231 stop:635 length:405 start_codon:yes stop_codon:yes gene_type:complete